MTIDNNSNNDKANQNIKPPPANTVGIIGWIRKNLLGGWVNTLLTLISIYILWLVLPPLFDWALLNADFSGSSGKNALLMVLAGLGWING